MTVYLLHFSEPVAHARHYVGYCKDDKEPRDRLQEHIDGRGNPLVRAASAAGAEVTIARVWPGESRDFERWLKNGKNVGRRNCPICLGRVPVHRSKSR